MEARGILEAWRRSGLPLDRFAAQRGLVPQRLRWWKSKLAGSEKTAAPAPMPAVLPVKVAAAARRGEPVTILLRTGHMLKVSHGFDEEAFVRVVSLLEGA